MQLAVVPPGTFTRVQQSTLCDGDARRQRVILSRRDRNVTQVQQPTIVPARTYNSVAQNRLNKMKESWIGLRKEQTLGPYDRMNGMKSCTRAKWRLVACTPLPQ